MKTSTHLLIASLVASAVSGPVAAQDPMDLLKELLKQKAPVSTDDNMANPEELIDNALDAMDATEDAAVADTTNPVLASAGMVSADDPGSVVTALQDYGVAAKLETDDVGDPVIRTKVGGASSNVYFYGCEEGVACKSISFTAGFELDEPYTLELANAWNADKRFSKSYVSDTGAARLEMDVNLVGGGVNAENFADLIDWWDYSVNEYKIYIGW